MSDVTQKQAPVLQAPEPQENTRKREFDTFENDQGDLPNGRSSCSLSIAVIRTLCREAAESRFLNSNKMT